jgi:hypothetical protein
MLGFAGIVAVFISSANNTLLRRARGPSGCGSSAVEIGSLVYTQSEKIRSKTNREEMAGT